MSDGAVQQPQLPPDEPRGRSRRFVAVAVAAVICVIVIILLVPVVATSSTSYCGSCHAMKAAYRSWQRGAHSSVPCSECHVPPGAVASFKWRSKETRNIWLAYLNMKPSRDLQAPPDTQNCIKCHPLKGLMGIPGKIRMPHAKHINQNNLECVDCHDHTAHAAPGQTSTVSMAPCTMCHEQTRDSSKCDFCHYTPPVSGQAHPTNFLDEHGKLALANEQDCVRCHHNKAQFCDGCHSKPTPGHYSGNWPYAHGLQAKKDRTRCLGCHSEKQLCNQCHTVDHPADWATSHAPVALKGERSCLVCHPKQMCIDCHAADGVTTQ